MALQSNLKNMALSLFCICFVCSGLLAGVYALTAEPIAKTNAELLKASISAVLPQGEISAEKTISVAGTDYTYYECTSGSDVVAYAIKSNTIGFGGTLSLMVGITADGKIYDTSVLSHAETPGLGAKCSDDASSFRVQFKGLDPSAKKLSVVKDGGNIDAITASTITSRAFTLAVANAVKVFGEITK